MSKEEKILVVDDEPEICSLLKAQLSEYQVHTCNCVDDALDALIQDDFDLVLTDLQMPKKSGIELVKDVISYAHLTPVIVMTGHGSKEETLRCLKIGAYDFFEKPWDIDEVKLSVRRGLDKSSIEKHKESLLLQLKIKNDELNRLNQIHQHSKKDDENYKLKKYYQRIISHDLRNIYNYLQHSLINLDGPGMEEGLAMLKELIPVCSNWEDIFLCNHLWKPEKVNFAEVVEKSLHLFEERILDKEITLEASGLDVNILTDRHILFHFVINNLIENAIKYSPTKGKISITGKINEYQTFCVEIIDEGTGIEKDTIENLVDLEKLKLDKGTMGERGIGGGLSMVDLSMNYLRAKWKIRPISSGQIAYEENDEDWVEQEMNCVGTQVSLYFSAA